MIMFELQILQILKHISGALIFMSLCINNMLSGGNQTDGNSLERFLIPYIYMYQHSRLPITQGLLSDDAML